MYHMKRTEKPLKKKEKKKPHRFPKQNLKAS